MFKLKNDINVVMEKNQSSQSVALCLKISLSGKESSEGTLNLMSRLVELNTQEQLNENTSFNCKLERDFLSFSFSFAIKDLVFTIEILSNLIKNPTFKNFEEGKSKIKEEIIAELDLEKTKVLDIYYKTLFEGHFYENSLTKTLENLENITIENVQNVYQQIFLKSKKVLSIVGDVDIESTKLILDKYLGLIENEVDQEPFFSSPVLKESKIVETIKKDIQKSLIVKGWIFPTFDSEDFISLVVLDAVLGFDGLCSRLFLELRGKQDIVYAVRSSYEPYKLCASFRVFISTDAKNIQKSLDASDKELDRLKISAVEDFELEYAKKKLVEKYKKINENNVTLANQLAYCGTMGLGFDFQSKIIENIEKVTSEQIQNCANKYFDDKFVVSILKPEIL